MNNQSFSSKIKKVALIAVILFVVYNAVLFILTGFTGHGASYWVSYAFMNISFAVVACGALLLRKRQLQPKDWMFGYPVIKHCAVYLISEFAVSAVFMYLDYAVENLPWTIATGVQLIVLAAACIMIISCFITQDTITQVNTKVKTSTAFMRTLQLDVQSLANRTAEGGVKKEIEKLAEKIRFSDPVSKPELSEEENKLTLILGQLSQAVADGNFEDAHKLCAQMALALDERNNKCKILK